MKNGYTISGYVENGQAAVPDVEVDQDGLFQYKVQTNSEGFFEIENMSAGRHELNMRTKLADGSYSHCCEAVEVQDDVTFDQLTLPDPVE